MEGFIRWVSAIRRCGKLFFDAKFEELGLSSSQIFAIKVVCAEPGITQDKLRPLINLDKSNITRTLDKLEKEGFIRKEPYELDKRTVCLYPTEKAETIYPLILKMEDEWISILVSRFTREEKDEFAALLEKAAKSARENMRTDER